MNDVFVEQIVERKQDLSTQLRKYYLYLLQFWFPPSFGYRVIRFIFPAVFALSMFLQ